MRFAVLGPVLVDGRPPRGAIERAVLTRLLLAHLMRAHYRAGRQAEALDAYRALARRLAQLGLQSGPEVREMEALVLRHAGELGPAPAVRPTNVGARVASVVGREHELEGVLAALDAHRIVSVVGPGGVGKTTLALAAARARPRDRPRGAAPPARHGPVGRPGHAPAVLPKPPVWLALRLGDHLAGRTLTADVKATDVRGRRQVEAGAAAHPRRGPMMRPAFVREFQEHCLQPALRS